MTEIWRPIVKKYQDQLSSENVDITNVDIIKNTRFIGLQLFLDDEYSKRIFETLIKIVPHNITKKMYLQDRQSLHLTLQATNLTGMELDKNKEKILVESIGKYFNNFRRLSGHFYFPIIGKSGIIQIFNDTQSISKMRKDITDLWEKTGLQPVLDQKMFNFPYSFVGRFTNKLTQDEIKFLLKLKEISIPVNFKLAKLCISDKFISKKTEQDLKIYSFTK